METIALRAKTNGQAFGFSVERGLCWAPIPDKTTDFAFSPRFGKTG